MELEKSVRDNSTWVLQCSNTRYRAVPAKEIYAMIHTWLAVCLIEDLLEKEKNKIKGKRKIVAVEIKGDIFPPFYLNHTQITQ